MVVWRVGAACRVRVRCSSSSASFSSAIWIAVCRSAISELSSSRRRPGVKGERSGLLGHLARPRPRSRLRVREPRRLPRGLDQADIAALLASFRSERDRAIAGLMLFSGLRSQEVLSLAVRDVDIARGWLQVRGKGDKERRVPLDPDVA